MHKKIFLALIISVAAFASSNKQSISDSGKPCCLKSELASRVHDREWLDIPIADVLAGKKVEVPTRKEIRRQFDFEYTVGKFVLNCRTATDSETFGIKDYYKKLNHPGCSIAAVLTLLRLIKPAAPLTCPDEKLLNKLFSRTATIGSRYFALYIEPRGDKWNEFYRVIKFKENSQDAQQAASSQAGTSNNGEQ